MLSNLEIAGDLLSGSECSSLAASPVHEGVFTFESQARGRAREREDESLRLRSLDPIDVVRDLLDRMNEPHVAEEFFAEDAKVEFYSAMVRGKDKKKREKRRGTARTTQVDLNDLLASCSRCNIQIDRIFACGEDVAAFGYLTYSDGPSSLLRDVRFSFSTWACVDVVRDKIVELRWLDQVVRAEDDRPDRQ
jgi:hypothetical protein